MDTRKKNFLNRSLAAAVLISQFWIFYLWLSGSLNLLSPVMLTVWSGTLILALLLSHARQQKKLSRLMQGTFIFGFVLALLTAAIEYTVSSMP